jgi:hypothetical protein
MRVAKSILLSLICLLLAGALAAKTKLSAADAAGGVRESMAQGVKAAILQLGKQDGFYADQAVKILLPERMQKIAKTARKLGASKYVDELELSMNRAAEKAVPQAADLFASAVQNMSVADALAIVSGQPDAGTQYFRRTTQDALRAKFLPIVTEATAGSGVNERYQKLMKKAGALGGLLGGGKSEEATDLNGYVTERAMDGLYYYVAQKEREIRANPLATGSSLLRRVFGR